MYNKGECGGREEVCWGVGEVRGDVRKGRSVGAGVGKCVGVWGEVRADVERGMGVWGV